MKCRTFQRKLSAYQDKELKPKEHEQVKTHLLSCQSCREQLENLDRVWQTLGELKEIHPDPWFYRQVIGRIQETRKRSLFPGLRHVFRVLRSPAMASILLIIGLAAGGYLGDILAHFNLFPFQTNRVASSQDVFFTSMRVFDAAPPGTFAEGYLRMVSTKEGDSR